MSNLPSIHQSSMSNITDLRASCEEFVPRNHSGTQSQSTSPVLAPQQRVPLQSAWEHNPALIPQDSRSSSGSLSSYDSTSISSSAINSPELFASRPPTGSTPAGETKSMHGSQMPQHHGQQQVLHYQGSSFRNVDLQHGSQASFVQPQVSGFQHFVHPPVLPPQQPQGTLPHNRQPVPNHSRQPQQLQHQPQHQQQQHHHQQQQQQQPHLLPQRTSNFDHVLSSSNQFDGSGNHASVQLTNTLLPRMREDDNFVDSTSFAQHNWSQSWKPRSSVSASNRLVRDDVFDKSPTLLSPPPHMLQQGCGDPCAVLQSVGKAKANPHELPPSSFFHYGNIYNDWELNL